MFAFTAAVVSSREQNIDYITDLYRFLIALQRQIIQIYKTNPRQFVKFISMKLKVFLLRSLMNVLECATLERFMYKTNYTNVD